MGDKKKEEKKIDKIGYTKDGRPMPVGVRFSSSYQPPEKWTEERALALADELIEWLKEKDEDGDDKGNMFYEEFLIIEKDLYLDVIRYLSSKFPSFSERISQARKIQEIKLMKYGVGGRLNAPMTKFTLTNNHGWKERNETQIGVNDTLEEAKKIADELKDEL